jgi:monolysocardiolipin acyltransferase
MSTGLDHTAANAWTPAAQAAVARWKPVPTLTKRMLSHVVVAGCRLWMRQFNTLLLEGEGRLLDARARPSGLLTFCNHVSLFDDPLLTSCLTDAEWTKVRWVAADALNFFGSPIQAPVFNAGKCVPIVRGAGVDQPGMHFLIEKLRAGEWVHIFPEGGRTRDPEERLRTPLKSGLAELVSASSPILLPFHHEGMQRVLPIGALLPRVGHTVRLRVGEAVDSATHLAGSSIETITAWATAQLQGLAAPTPTERHVS